MKEKPIIGGEYYKIKWDNSLPPFMVDVRRDTRTRKLMDALDFLKSLENESCDGVLLDPPYSLRQISEHYKEAGIKVTGWHTSSGWNKKIKDESSRVLKKGGKVLCFGWSSMGLGKNRGYEMQRILLVPHGGNKNDTLVTVEIKL